MTDVKWDFECPVGTTNIERELFDLPQDFYLRFVRTAPPPDGGAGSSTLKITATIVRFDKTTDTHDLWDGPPYYLSYGRLVKIRIICEYLHPSGSYKGSVTIGYQATPY